MSSPELIDERYSEIVRELRALPGAPERVHEYVRKVAANEPAPRRRLLPRLTLRQTGFALAGAAASVVAVSLVYGLVSSGGPGGKTAASTRSLPARAKAAQPAHTAAAGGAGRAPATTTALQTATVALVGKAAPTAAPAPPSKKTFSAAP